MNRPSGLIARLFDTLMWKAVAPLSYDEDQSIAVLERHRFSGKYRLTKGYHA